MPVQQTTASGAAAPVNNPSWGDIGKAFNEAAKALAIKLIPGIRACAPGNKTTSTVPPAGAPIAMAEPEGAIAGPTAAGPAENPQNVRATEQNQARQWLIDQCKTISTKLGQAELNPQPELHKVYEVAKEFKQALSNNQERLQLLWPADLQEDFQANLQLIEQHFQGVESTKISLVEVDFLLTYINFMKTCVGEAGGQLEQQFCQLENLFTKVRSKLIEQIDTKNNELKNIKNEIQTEQVNIQNLAAQIEAINQIPAADRTAAQNTELTRLGNEREALLQAEQQNRQTTEQLQIEISRLSTLPGMADVPALAKQVDDLEQAVANAQMALDDLPDDAPERSQQELNQTLNEVTTNLRTKRDQLENAQQHRETILREPNSSIKTDTQRLLGQQQTVQAKRLGLEVDPGPQGLDSIFNKSVKLLANECQDVCKLATRSNKVNKEWGNASLLMLNRINTLHANQPMPGVPAEAAGHALPPLDELPTELTSYLPNNASAQRKIGGRPVYEYALNIVQSKVLEQNPENPDAVVNVCNLATQEEKTLAHIVVGAWAAKQAAALRGNNFAETDRRTDTLLTHAADLLGASIQMRLGEDTNTLDQAITSEINFEERSGHGEGEIRRAMNSLGNDAQTEDKIAMLKQSVALRAVSDLKAQTSAPSDLMAMATTNRTFANDLTVSKGNSRQEVFKESMVRAIELMKSPASARQERLGSDTRISAASSVELDTPLAIKAKLGFPQEGADGYVSDALLDQLAIAAIAHNDLSTEADHAHRGSMLAKIKRHDNHSTAETLIKNHNLNGYRLLSQRLTDTAIAIRPEVADHIQTTQTALEDPTQTVRADQINRLVKQIIITTDSKSALNENFNLAELIENGDNLVRDNTEANRMAFSASLEGVKKAWVANLPQSEGGEELQTQARRKPEGEQWNTQDSRNSLARALKSNPIKNASFINRIPLVARLTAGVLNIAKGLISAGGLFAVGAGVSALAIPAVIVAMPVAIGGIASAYFLPKLFR
ncbi:hypothetical protein [Limnobacter sp.]|uniref:hypothetical protein n=1 Tax=Limnobacter sp. TaxID=2003368 RepID=UPI003511AABD